MADSPLRGVCQSVYTYFFFFSIKCYFFILCNISCDFLINGLIFQNSEQYCNGGLNNGTGRVLNV